MTRSLGGDVDLPDQIARLAIRLARNLLEHCVYLDERVALYTASAGGGPAVLHVKGAFEGEYVCAFYDMFDGIVLGAEKITGTSRGIEIPVPRFRHDIAVKCVRNGTPAPEVDAKRETPLHDRFEKILRDTR